MCLLLRMIRFAATIERFKEQGEKTGWTYIVIPAEKAQKLSVQKTSFRVKGKLDEHPIKQVALIPMGEGDFILPLNAVMRKALGKKKGYTLEVQIGMDKSAFEFNADLVACIEDEPKAQAHFETLSGSHQRYFSKWIDSAKTDATKAKRILQAVTALAKGWGYPEMIRDGKKVA